MRGSGVPGPPGRVRFANWPAYIDEDAADPGRHPTLAEFTRLTGIDVDYSEPITGNERFFASIGVPLAMGDTPRYDLAVLTDWMVDQFIDLGWARELRPEAVPGARNLLPALRGGPLASVLGSSLPWQAGLTGIACNLAATGRAVSSITDLLTAPDLRGRVSLVADMRDDVGLVMLEHGHDPADFTDAQFDLALEVLDRAVRTGQISAVTNNYLDRLDRGEIAACVGWAGNVLGLRSSNPDIRFVLPETGGMLWTDNMVILSQAPNATEAERLMDYYYQPEVAARLAAALRFICPVAGAYAWSGQGEHALTDERYVFPPPQVFAAAHYFKRLTPVENSRYGDKFSAAAGL